MKAREYLFMIQKVLQYIDEGIHIIDKNGNTIIYNEAMSSLEKIDYNHVIN